MARLELHAEPRAVLGKQVKRLRREGIVPANIYGHGASRAIQAPAASLEQLLAHGGRRSIISVAVDGKKETALVKQIQRDPRSGRLVHVDLQLVSMNESVTTRVPIHFVGEAPAARLGGLLLHPMTDVEVQALARDLPASIEVDISSLEELGSSIKVADLTLPKGVSATSPAEEVVATVQAPRVEREEVEEAIEAAAEAAAAPPAEEPASTEEAAEE